MRLASRRSRARSSIISETLIYLVRHGEAAAKWGEDPDPGLSVLGREQAQAIAARLALTLNPDAQLVSSPLLRAQQTGAPLASLLGVELQVDQRFTEVPGPERLVERQHWLKAFMAGRWAQQPRALLDWRDAAVRALMSLDTETVIFTHFLMINAVVAAATDNPDTLCFRPDNASVTCLRAVDGSLQLESLGKELATHIN